MIKRYIKILLTLIISMIIIISPCTSKAVVTTDSSEAPVSTNREDGTSQTTQDDTDDEIRMYTIEEIIFNKIPVLNVNVFNTTDTKEGSIAMRIRTSIATWYVSFRNIAIICLAFVLVYIGIRMAMATVASDKANYKRMLINWMSAILIVFFIHFIMMFVFYINDTLVNLISRENTTSDIPIYETIRTRTKDFRFSVGMPAAVMYWVLFIYSLMFLWVYIKRLFTVLILIIIAPLVGVKYAIDSAGKGQRSKIFMTWTYEFSMNVLLQSIHALLYVALMQIAINLATTNVMGFILALVFINFIFKADKIFMRIFHFDRSKLIKDIAEPKKNLREEFAGALFIGGVAKDAAGATKNIAVKGARVVKRSARDLYRDHVSEEKRNNIKDKKNNILDKVDNTLNSAYKKITRGKDSYYLQLRMMSRKKGKEGNVAKRNLKKAKQQIKARYTAPFKFIKQAGGGILMIGMSLPMAVVNPAVGLNMFVKGTTGLHGMASEKDDKGNKYKGKEGVKQALSFGGYGRYKSLKKGNKKVGQTVSYLKQATVKEDEIQREFNKTFEKFSDEAIRKYKKEVKFYIKFANQDNLNMILRQGLAGKGIVDINDENIDLVINDMTKDVFEKLGIEKQYSQNMANQIRARMIKDAKSLYDAKKSETEKFEFGSMDLAVAFSGAIKDEGVGSEIRSEFMTKAMDKVLEDETFDKVDTNNVGDVVNRFTDVVLQELNISNKSGDSGSQSDSKVESDSKAESDSKVNRYSEVESDSKAESSSKVESDNEEDSYSKVESEIRDRANQIMQEAINKKKQASGSLEFSRREIKHEIQDKIQKVVETSGRKVRIDFGYGNVTKAIEELHEINKNAQKDIKTTVVKENRFIDSL